MQIRVTMLAIIFAVIVFFPISKIETDAEAITEKQNLEVLPMEITNVVFEKKIEKKTKKEFTIYINDCDTYYITATSGVNIRKKPTIESAVVETYPWSTKVELCKTSKKKYLGVKFEKIILGYICKDYVSKKKPKSRIYDISEYHLKNKSYSDMRTVTAKGTDQYKLRQLTEVGPYGVMTVNGRYCVALGTRFKCAIGQYFDIILSNGTAIRCIKCDVKANEHTDSTNVYTLATKCATEFYCYTPSLYSAGYKSGNLNCIPEFNGYIEAIKVYKERIKL